MICIGCNGAVSAGEMSTRALARIEAMFDDSDELVDEEGL
jgi:hypothetical protein